MKTLLLTTIFCLLSSLAPAQTFLDKLSPDEQKQVLSGERLVKEVALKDEVWPRLHIYQKVNSSAEKLKAAFLDYESATKFVPNLLSAKVTSRPSPQSATIDYIIDIPILADQSYSTLNTLQPYGKGYEIAWKITKGDAIKSGEGDIKILPLSETTSLLCYTNHISPRMERIAKLIKRHVKNQAGQAVDGLIEASKG